MSSKEEKQMNLGLYSRQAVEEIALEFDKYRLMIREQGLPSVTRAQIAYPMFKKGIKWMKIWWEDLWSERGRGLSLFESFGEAKKEVLRDLIRKDMDDYMVKFMSGVFEIVKRHADELVEVILDGS
jgi:hypothetical protein